ncbi:MAG: hypothetical protein ABI625_15110 [bacterium]
MKSADPALMLQLKTALQRFKRGEQADTAARPATASAGGDVAAPK